MVLAERKDCQEILLATKETEHSQYRFIDKAVGDGKYILTPSNNTNPLKQKTRSTSYLSIKVLMSLGRFSELEKNPVGVWNTQKMPVTVLFQVERYSPRYTKVKV